MAGKYRIYTLGCKVNQQESEEIGASFEALGFVPATGNEIADVCVINSCTVTSMADSKTRQKIRLARRNNPDAFICVAGCLPEVERDKALGMPEVDMVVGSTEKGRTAELVCKAYAERRGESQRAGPVPPASISNSGRACCDPDNVNTQNANRTRAFIKVEDGCDRFCSYCIIPYARGAVRSKPESEVLSEAETLLKAGYKELVLTGVNLALYGQDFRRNAGFDHEAGNAGMKTCDDAGDLYPLVEKICAIDPGSEFRVRLGSLEPTVIDARGAAKLAAIKGVCPHFHLSLQSGCEKTLRAMGRPYTPEDYEAIVKELRGIDPLFSITTDVIVGFPGETDEDFTRSLDFIKRIGFAKVHVFKYSKRKGTIAAEMPDQVQETVKNERSRMLIDAAEEGEKGFFLKNAGKIRQTLILVKDLGDRIARGITDNGIEVKFRDEGCKFKPNEFYDIELHTPDPSDVQDKDIVSFV